MAERTLESRLQSAAPLLLDGALGTELERRGVGARLPLWSTHALLEAPDLVRTVHREYLDAGVEALTANTFRTQERVLARAGLGDRAPDLTRAAVSLARQAAVGCGRPTYVLGSAPPLEDCYRPDLVPTESALAREHEAHARNLVAAGVDGILVETMNSVREAKAAARACSALSVPFIVSFVAGADARLLSGEPLCEAVAAVTPHAPLCVAVNCLPASDVDPCLADLASGPLPFGVYPNLGAPTADGAGRTGGLNPEAFAAHTRRWREAGASLIGGCCGTTPAHLEAAFQLG